MEEKFYFINSKNNKLCGILSNPTGDKSKPIIILCHGFASNKNRPSYISIVKELAKNNISTFRFDFFGHGESEGNFEDLTQSEAVDDALCAIKFIKSLGYKKIALSGSSFGGLAATMAASKTKSIYLLVLKAPVSSYYDFPEYNNDTYINKWKTTGYTVREGKKLKFSFYEDIKNNIAYNVAKNIKIPTLIVHGDTDTDVPLSQSQKLCKLIPNCRLKIIHGAGHRFVEGDTKQEMITTLTKFIVENSKENL